MYVCGGVGFTVNVGVHVSECVGGCAHVCGGCVGIQ